jgi:hypothetical protein
VALDPEQRSRLLLAKLRRLVTASEPIAFVPATATPAPYPGGAALFTADRAVVLVDEQPARALGGVLAWAEQRGVAQVDLIVEREAGVLARRASCFDRPVTVWRASGTSLEIANAEPAHVPVVPSEDSLDLVGGFRDAGLDIVVEHGRVGGEILGLEVARVVTDDGPAHVEVGVGRHDREAFAIVHGDVPTADALGHVVDQVREHRRPGDLTHPLARLAAERWLRSEVLRHPDLAGAAVLEPAEPTVYRGNVMDPVAAIATGTSHDGSPVVVACSVGVDLDLVSSAADARLAYAPDGRLVLVVPERDAHAITQRLADRLVEPAELRTVPDDFRR